MHMVFWTSPLRIFESQRYAWKDSTEYNDVTCPMCVQIQNLEMQSNQASELYLACTLVFLMPRSSKQDHTCLCLRDIFKKYFLNTKY